MKNTFVLFFLTIMVSHLYGQKTIIHCGKLVDVRSEQMLSEMTIIVERDIIVDLVRGYEEPSPEDSVINLKDRTVMPGLIDMHVHLVTETRRGATIDRFTMNPADHAFKSVLHAKRTLLAGFTTVRDLGGPFGVNIALRNAINHNRVIGPRVFTSGTSIATTGGHADRTNGYRKDLVEDPGPEDGVVNGPEDCAKAVRQRYKEGSDLIKITASGGVLSLARSPENSQFTEEEIRAIVATARDYDFKVAAHAHGAEGMKRAVRAGVHSIEHGTYMDDEAIELFKAYGTYLVPTITAGKSTADSASIEGYYPEMVTAKALVVGPHIQNTFAKAYKAGVKIAFGTDAGVFPHGKNWIEFVYMHEAGMPVVSAIRSATLEAASLLGNPDLGSIEKGKLADIVAVEGNPVDDIYNMGRVRFVMKGGVIYKNE